MKFKLYLILFLCGLALPSSVLSASELPSGSDVSHSPAVPVDQALDSQSRADLLIQRLDESHSGDRFPSSAPKVSHTYTEDGFLSGASLGQGIRVEVSYVKQQDDEISGVRVQLNHSGGIVFVDVDRNQASNRSPADPDSGGILIMASHDTKGGLDGAYNDFGKKGLKFWGMGPGELNAPYDIGKKGLKSVSKDLSGSGEWVPVEKEKLADLTIRNIPFYIHFDEDVDDSAFDRLLSSLRKNPTKLSSGEDSKPIDFSPLKEVLEGFEKGQDESFRQYQVQTQVYYEGLASLLNETAAPPEQAPAGGADSADREEIDRRVQAVAQDDARAPERGISRILTMEPVLADTYLAPNRDKLQKALENNIAHLQKSLYELLVIQGDAAIVRRDQGNTEILILLPQRD